MSRSRRKWASPCSGDTGIRQTEWRLAAPLGPYDRALTPPSHSRQALLLGSLIESQHRDREALYIRVLSERLGIVAEPLHCSIIGLLPILATYTIDERARVCVCVEYSEKDAYT